MTDDRGWHAHWRFVYGSMQGVQHRQMAMPCQDACAVKYLSHPNDGSPVLILVAADGAGSATHSQLGAIHICSLFVIWMESQLALGEKIHQRSVAELLIGYLQDQLVRLAMGLNLQTRDLACTLVGALITEHYGTFFQIGDGAVVINDTQGYRPVFWPQTGEYDNETYFVTDRLAIQGLDFTVIDTPIREVALLTDGLQRLALHYHTRQAHQRFFQPLFAQLNRVTEPGQGYCHPLKVPLLQFLDSPAVNERSHDDKTLILASRHPPSTATARG